ncbi:DNA/RNA nuclease SfsA [Candidatus Endoriftia persephonae]|jgi:sugar fermentation stimulation protein A|uniref:Sugar fermentation stimulation protein homolog n=2 Tax=Gammaproteobacteria TaxID=1236 RepID=G2FDQ2_9GAMM|nr:DNA/RNA nuclease SfsA [Candidatus Endoriftia persephone]EGW55107.1 sugar fermentation stimulation protein [endosymbiont of Tevnia jerichonana (vent Tica)]USF88287.1 DNA/RNA nuclease SfsA [Candidatus Endoriftia persephone]
MELPPLVSGRIEKRYKRFLADVELEDGRQVIAHCPNTGSMLGCWRPGAAVQLSHSDNPRRKLEWTLERVEMGGGWIGVHTGRTNPVIEEAVRAGLIDSLAGYARVERERVFEVPGEPRSRFDLFLAQGPRADAWVEVKNVTLLEGASLLFPDAVTERGRKHLRMLAEACRRGYRGVMVYAINRPEGTVFSPAEQIDPNYAETLRRVVAEAGVELVAVRIAHGVQSMSVAEAVPIVL